MSEQAYHHIWQVPVDHPAFAGHFLGRPIVPGVLILDQAMLCAQRMRPACGWQIVHSKFLRYNALEDTEAAAVPVAQDVLQMVAEYGYDLDSSGKIDQSNEWTATTPTQPNLGRLIAVRIAVLVRTSQYEKDEVTTENPRWANGAKAFDVSAVDS